MLYRARQLLALVNAKRLLGSPMPMQMVVDVAQARHRIPSVRRLIEKLSDRVEDLLALVLWDGSGWKEPRKDRRNGL
jgi:hypothetical protein